MTKEDAILDFKKSVDAIEANIDSFCKEYKECMIETKEQFELAIEAIEKQIPKKPKENCNNDCYIWKSLCPNCGSEMDYDYKPRFCDYCGQALDWSEEE